MKTVAQIAAEIGVSKQAIHKKIKQEPLSTSLRGLTTTKGNTLYIEVDGENLIKSAFDKDKPTTTTTTAVDDITAQFIASLQGQIATLTEQNQDLREQLNQEREHSRTQADRITDLATEMAKLAGNAQKLHAGDMIPRLTSGEAAVSEPPQEREDKHQENERPGIIGRLFGKKK